jgi:hypothetical protein
MIDGSWCWRLDDEGWIHCIQKNTKLGFFTIGANQNGARKHHCCALLIRKKWSFEVLASFARWMGWWDTSGTAIAYKKCLPDF